MLDDILRWQTPRDFCSDLGCLKVIHEMCECIVQQMFKFSMRAQLQKFSEIEI